MLSHLPTHRLGQRADYFQGEHWKVQRRRLSPGFAPQHLLTTLPIILDKMQYFLGHLDRLASTGEQFSLDELATNLTFDIIGAVTMDQDFKAQVPGQQSELLTLFMKLSATFKGRNGPGLPFMNWRKDRRRAQLARQIEGLMKTIVRNEYARVAAPSAASAAAAGDGRGSRSVLALSLQGTEELTPDLLQQTSDNLRVFMFAGHDTTSILMQWALYELTRAPRQRRALIGELDELFGADPDPEAVGARLLAPGGAELLNQMPYASVRAGPLPFSPSAPPPSTPRRPCNDAADDVTQAVIKETLRLHPPAASVRMTAPGTNFQLTLPGGKQICPDGCIMYLNASLIQHDRAVWGDTADEFVPERWLGDTSWMPAGAWRPFERGPRSCIGLELANIEAKVILALVARRFDFAKVGVGELDLDGEGRPVLDAKGYYRTKSELFNVSPPPLLREKPRAPRTQRAC